jgi:hypothetical protein
MVTQSVLCVIDRYRSYVTTLFWEQNVSNVTENDNEAARKGGAKTLQEVACFEALRWNDCRY